MDKQPFQRFGQQLKQIRKRAKETIDEVSCAVEVDINHLFDIESGKAQPSEDIVLLLISHFALTDEEAIKMWELAGYKNVASNGSALGQSQTPVQTAIVTAADIKIIYTDMVHINANKYGVVIDFLQGLGGHNQPIAISRIGMSRDHAKSLLKVLQHTLKVSEKPNDTDTEAKK